MAWMMWRALARSALVLRGVQCNVAILKAMLRHVCSTSVIAQISTDFASEERLALLKLTNGNVKPKVDTADVAGHLTRQTTSKRLVQIKGLMASLISISAGVALKRGGRPSCGRH